MKDIFYNLDTRLTNMIKGENLFISGDLNDTMLLEYWTMRYHEINYVFCRNRLLFHIILNQIS
jgi:ABC-type transporter Mla MlaB component